MATHCHAMFQDGSGDVPRGRIFFNIAGSRFQVSTELLADCSVPVLKTLAQSHDQAPSSEYYFDRNPHVFEAILDFVRSGELHAPRSVCGRLLLSELKEWGLTADSLSACCIPFTAQALSTHYDSLRIEKWNRPEKSVEEIEQMPDGWTKTKWKAWLVLDHPQSSRIALVYGLLSFTLVLVSVISMYLQSTPGYKRDFRLNHLQTNTPSYQLFVLDNIVACIFTLEIGVRLLLCPRRRRYFRDILNWIDILAVIPFYIEIGVVVSLKEQDLYSAVNGSVYMFLSLLRVLRVLRLYHLFKWFAPMKLIVLTLKASTGALLMLLCLLSCLIVTFSALLYYAEHQQEYTGISDMFVGLYWAIITLTTVGYGDLTPLSIVGRVVASIAAICGLLTFAIALAPLSSNFSAFFEYFAGINSFREHKKKEKSKKKYQVNNE